MNNNKLDNLALKKTQTKLLKHHGGNGFRAQQAILNSYESRHNDEFWRFWNKQVACHYQVGDGVIDMGAGAGLFVRDCANRYPQSKIIGIDAANYMVNGSIPMPQNAELIIDDLNNPTQNLAENSVAMIMANTVIHELTQPIKMFKTAYKWLKPNGRFCIIEGNRQPLSTALSKRYTPEQLWGENTSTEALEQTFQYHFEHNQYQKEDIEFLLIGSGFKIIKSELTHQQRLIRIVVEKPVS